MQFVDIILKAMQSRKELEWFTENHAKIVKAVMEEPVFTMAGLKKLTQLNEEEIKQTLQELVQHQVLSPRLLEAFQVLNESFPLQQEKMIQVSVIH